MSVPSVPADTRGRTEEAASNTDANGAMFGALSRKIKGKESNGARRSMYVVDGPKMRGEITWD